MAKNQNKINIARLEERIKALQEKFDYFLENDFQHLREQVEQIEDKFLVGFSLMIVSTIILQILMKIFKF